MQIFYKQKKIIVNYIFTSIDVNSFNRWPCHLGLFPFKLMDFLQITCNCGQMVGNPSVSLSELVFVLL